MVQSAKDTLFRVISRRIAPCDIRDSIVISGSPRSGTTWLLELLRTLPGYKAMNEPLMYEEARREHGFLWRTYLDPGAEAPAQREYLDDILAGRIGISPSWHFEAASRPTQLLEHATRSKLVVKFCRLSRMLHWFAGQFDVRGPVFIIRHPCAVVASMLRHGGWEREQLRGNEARKHVEPEAGLPESVRPTFEPILERITTRTEALATLWCLDHYIPLLHHGNESRPWILVPYERLVAQGRSELQRVLEALDVEMTSEMQNQFSAPSSSVKDQLHQDAEKQLSKWRRRLSEEQIDAILRIVDEVGLTAFYTRALEPQHEELNRYQHPAYQW